MPRSDEWKPCDALVPEDFVRHPIWGFDLGRESDPEADETWVRPWSFPTPPDWSDVLFASATLRLRNGEILPGAVTFRFSRGRVEVEDVFLLRPRYLPISETDSRRLVDTLDRTATDIYPIAFEATIPVGEPMQLRGTIPLGAR